LVTSPPEIAEFKVIDEAAVVVAKGSVSVAVVKLTSLPYEVPEELVA
jgi:hypothetical protein